MTKEKYKMKIKKISFDEIDTIFQALRYAFLHTRPDEQSDDIDPRFVSMWQTALLLGSWEEDEYFDAVEEMEYEEHECPECAAEREEIESLPSIDETKKDAKSKAN